MCRHQQLQENKDLHHQQLCCHHSHGFAVICCESTLRFKFLSSELVSLNQTTFSCIVFPQNWCQTLTSPSPCQRRIPTAILQWSPVILQRGLHLSPFHFTTGQNWLLVRQLKGEPPRLRFHWSWVSTWDSCSARQAMEIGPHTVNGFP